MIASLLRLVLVLTLACNGFGAPIAMAHGTHTGLAEATAATAQGGDHHASHHHDHGTPGVQQPGPMDAEAAGCCDSPDCRCGCVLLSPAMSLATAPVVRHARPGHPATTDVGRLEPAALSAPFRPPSG